MIGFALVFVLSALLFAAPVMLIARTVRRIYERCDPYDF